MASASWKLCSMSGLHTPSASLSSPLSRPSGPSSRASPGLPLAVQLLDAIVLVSLGSGPEPAGQPESGGRREGEGRGPPRPQPPPRQGQAPGARRRSPEVNSVLCDLGGVSSPVRPLVLSNEERVSLRLRGLKLDRDKCQPQCLTQHSWSTTTTPSSHTARSFNPQIQGGGQGAMPIFQVRKTEARQVTRLSKAAGWARGEGSEGQL